MDRPRYHLILSPTRPAIPYDWLDYPANYIYILFVITGDEPKRAENLTKHGIDLAELESAFDFPMVTVEDDRLAYGEHRLQSFAFWRGRVVFLVQGSGKACTIYTVKC